MKSMLKWTMLILVCLAISACGNPSPTNPATPPASATTPTAESFVFAVTPVGASITREAGVASNLDEENLRIMNTAFDNLFEQGSVQYELRLATVINRGAQHIEFTLDGSGHAVGLSMRENTAKLDGTFEGTLVADGITYHFIFDFLFDGGRIYLRIFAENGSGETRQTPWLYIDLDETIEQITGQVPSDSNGLTPAATPEFPTIEEFFGQGGFSEYIDSVRLSDEGNLAHFRRHFDLPGMAGSDAFLNLLLLSREMGGTPPITEQEARDLVATLPAMVQALFPVLNIEMHQYVDVANMTLNRVTLDLDVEFDEAQINAENPYAPRLDLKADLSLSLSNHGDDFAITVPTDAVPLESYEIEPLPTPSR